MVRDQPMTLPRGGVTATRSDREAG